MAITVNGGSPTANLTLSSELSAAITDESGTGALVFATSPTLTTPTLGTANATAIELGHATDTTLARASAGVVNIEGVPIVTTTATQTLTNKTLTTPVISAISNTGIVTLPTATDTLVGRATTDTLTNKTLTSPTVGGGITHSGSTSGTTVLQSSAIASGTLTLPAATDTLVGKATTDTLTNKTLTSPNINGGTLDEIILNAPQERTTISATAAGSTVHFDIKTQGVLYYTTTSTGNWTLNVRGDSGTTLNSLMTTGDALTIVFMATNVTAYYSTALTIDSVSITPKFQNGTAFSAGSASATDIYSYTIFKTASATFTVLASQTKFA